MKVKFLKDHVRHSKHDVADLEDAHANYLVRVGAAEVHEPTEKKHIKEPAEKKQIKKAPEKKHIKKPGS